MAQDFLNCNIQAENSKENQQFCLDNITVQPELDPDIETLELVSVIPIECVNLSLFHRRKKRTLKARLCNGRVLYFELGGFRDRKMLWNLWRERVKYLNPEVDGSSNSETTAASSSSCSTLYLARRRSGVTSSGENQVWNVYSKHPEGAIIQKKLQSATNFHESPPIRQRWTDRNLFPTDLNDVHSKPDQEEFSSIEFDLVEREKLFKNFMVDEVMKNDLVDIESTILPWSLSNKAEMNLINERHEDTFQQIMQKDDLKGKREPSKSYLVHRFDCGISENCCIPLYLFPMKSSPWDPSDTEANACENAVSLSREDFINLMDAGVNIWEQGTGVGAKAKHRHLRRYGIAPCPQFFHGLGPFGDFLTRGERHSVHSRRVASAIELHKIVSSEYTLPLPKHQLVATISCESLTLPVHLSYERKKCEHLMSRYPYTPLPTAPVFFWTRDLLYWPRSSQVIYHRQRQIMKSFHNCVDYPTNKFQEVKHTMHKKNLDSGDADKKRSSLNIHSNSRGRNKNKTEMQRRKRIAKGQNWRFKNDKVEIMDQGYMKGKSGSTQFKRLLRLDIKLTAWDFDSTTIAHQLTMIDRDLFLQIPVSELGILVHWKSYLIEKSFLYPLTSWHSGTPCIAAFISFSNRISCLISSEILKGESLKVRARLIARFINAANKCYQLQNFQSCQSILFGLQSPAIYRLQQTWHHVRLRHATKYEMFEHLCRFYKNIQLTGYSDFSKDYKKIPFIPCISFIISYLFDQIPNATLCGALIGVPHSQPRKQKLISTKAMEEYQETAFSNNRVKEGNAQSESHSTLLQFFLSTFRMWPSISHRRHKYTEKVYGEKSNKLSIKSSSIARIKESKVKNNDCCCWVEKADPELKAYFNPVIDEVYRRAEVSSNEKHYSLDQGTSCSNEIFSDYRMELFKKAAEMLLLSQHSASNYSLVQSDLAKEYFLKARYKGHQENYSQSFQLENARR